MGPAPGMALYRPVGLTGPPPRPENMFMPTFIMGPRGDWVAPPPMAAPACIPEVGDRGYTKQRAKVIVWERSRFQDTLHLLIVSIQYTDIHLNNDITKASPSTTMDEYPRELFVDKVNEDFICSICLNVLYKPLETLECHHLFCAHCIRDWLAKNPQATCPIDRKTISPTSLHTPSPSLMRVIGNLKLRCPEGGCNVTVCFSDITEHRSSCRSRQKNEGGEKELSQKIAGGSNAQSLPERLWQTEPKKQNVPVPIRRPTELDHGKEEKFKKKEEMFRKREEVMTKKTAEMAKKAEELRKKEQAIAKKVEEERKAAKEKKAAEIAQKAEELRKKEQAIAKKVEEARKAAKEEAKAKKRTETAQKGEDLLKKQRSKKADLQRTLDNLKVSNASGAPKLVLQSRCVEERQQWRSFEDRSVTMIGGVGIASMTARESFWGKGFVTTSTRITPEGTTITTTTAGGAGMANRSMTIQGMPTSTRAATASTGGKGVLAIKAATGSTTKSKGKEETGGAKGKTAATSKLSGGTKAAKAKDNAKTKGKSKKT
ncbi:unnamed protein product [Cyprideis torosa]|uniref:Uncharacterized protein n=1 Tax=Cyprideis torosa TaxID=163714 RepID=A0A7R8WAS2_9CRUS|nr:unnamed protein product [Cyprideis torosa]CAG0888708.1 unnamed protein product [Cyprideis torosa]